jgi:hypothetical protein
MPATDQGSFTSRLREIGQAARRGTDDDPWIHPLRRLKGHIGHDKVERVSTHDVFDVLEVPMRQRASKTVRLSRVMRDLGWSNIRARGLNPGSYRDRVRGYAREVSPKSPPRR